MASKQEKQLQAQYEESLKASIISLVQAVYGPKHPRGCTFDVVASKKPDISLRYTYIAYVIVYPSPSDSSSTRWRLLLQTPERSDLRFCYESLIHALQVDMVSVMDNAPRADDEMEESSEARDE
ncbi:uncharacterized protein J4E78_004949 [Alternaria triticimaculans]|uniref:uncharacterized protein n=1 Tax=Alternaria triticimaculans TaxID=297637 RepID=UPI0020C5ACA9|nr:uncharacterized protein J4E78_004949 [Alternaria triticimaculans]KAI4660248.1 hypothetical protein J4E78_004949 [Alternaria triticimaculans]